MKQLHNVTGVCLSALLVCAQANAANDEHRDHDAHEHGTALLNMAIENNNIHLELESPAMNIVGFEHQAKTKQDKLTIKNAVERLNQGNTLFVTSAKAQCKLTSVDVESALIDSKDKHDDHDEHDKHDKHDDHDEHEETHSEFHVTYMFTCKNIAELKSIDAQIFTFFKGSEEIHVQLITDKGQTEKELTPSNHILKF